MTFHFCGYFPKKVTPRPEGYDLPGVVDIASVSNCIAKGPDDWMQSWTFNTLGFFDDVNAAESIISEPDRPQFEVHAYEFLDERFAGGLAEPWTIPPLACKRPGNDFEPLGFDVVSKSVSDFFECSPLSCKGEATTFMTNPHCLFDALDDAVAAAKVFSEKSPNPDLTTLRGSCGGVRQGDERRGVSLHRRAGPCWNCEKVEHASSELRER